MVDLRFLFTNGITCLVIFSLKIFTVGAQMGDNPSGSMRPPSGSMPFPSGSMMSDHMMGPYNIYIVNIDNSRRTNVSSYISNYNLMADFPQDNTYGTYMNNTMDPIGLNTKFTLNFYDESTGAQINYMSVRVNNTDLNLQNDVSMTSSISSKVFPRNYFNNNLFSGAGYNTPLQCKYTNPGPYYELSSEKNVDIDFLVSTVNKNFGLNLNEKGIKIVLMSNGTITYSDLDSYVNMTNLGQNYSSTNGIQFTKLFAGSDPMENNPFLFHLAAIGADQNLYLYNITDENYSTVNIVQWDVISSASFNSADVNKVVFYNGQIFLSSPTLGFTVLTKNSNWGVLTTNQFLSGNVSFPLQLSDIAIVNSTLFMIANNVGMLSWDLNLSKFNQNYFNHPNLVRIDYTLYRSAFIGVCVNNSVLNTTDYIPEVFIEFIYNFTNPAQPLINKIYTSSKDIKVEDVVTDNFLGLTYIMERTSTMLTILVRGILHILTSYDLQVDLRGAISHSKRLELMLISQNDQFNPSLAIKNDKDYLLMSRFAYPQNSLECQASQPGHYTIQFNAPADCSSWDILPNAFYCYLNNTIDIYVDPLLAGAETEIENKTVLWIVLAVVLVIILCIVFVVLFCKVSCFKKGEKPLYQRQVASHRQGEEIEVQVVDNKQ